MKGPKSGTFNTAYPQNMIADALGVSISEIPYDDVDDTAEYLLEQLGTIERDLLIRRYKYQESYQQIGDEYDTFARSIQLKIQISLKKMATDRNGLYLKYGCCRLEEGPPVITEDTRISELDIPGSLLKEIYEAAQDAVSISSVNLRRSVIINEDDDKLCFDQYKDSLIIADITLLIRIHAFKPTTATRIAKRMHVWGFMDDDIYGKDYCKTRMLSDWHGKDISLPVTEDQFPWNLIKCVIGSWGMLTGYIDHIKVYDVLSSLYHVLGTLPDERLAEILLLYYRDGMTVAEIGRVLNITGSRVSDLKNRALQKLRHPSRRIILVWGWDQYIDYLWDDRRLYYEDIISNYEKRIDDTHNESAESSEEVVNNPFATPIADLPLKGAIGTRIRNGLNRSGYDKVGDCVELFKSGEIVNVHGIGEYSIQELRNALKCIGITDEDLSSKLQKE